MRRSLYVHLAPGCNTFTVPMQAASEVTVHIKKYIHVPSEEDVAVSQFRSFLNAIVRRLK